MFTGVHVHELAHSALVWYSKGACDSPQISWIDREGGFYVEKAFFGGIVAAEFHEMTKSVTAIGLLVGEAFYAISESQFLMLAICTESEQMIRWLLSS